MLRSRKSRREEPLDAHVPEPIVSLGDGVDPEHEALLADSVGLALIVVLETLAPAERLALVNGAAGVVVTRAGQPFAVMGCIVAGSKIVEIDILADPERLRQLDLKPLSD